MGDQANLANDARITLISARGAGRLRSQPMASVLVTVAGPQRSTDLALPAEAPVGELIPELVSLCVDPALRRASARWALAPVGGDPFPPGRAVGDLGVLDRTVLQLRDMTSAVPSAPAAPGSAETIDPARLERRQGITGLVEDLVHEAARLAGGHPAGHHTGIRRETVEDLRAIVSPAPAVGDRLIPASEISS
jgi:hypothetical protein